jgi:RecB family endonuclease NucS
MPAEDIVRDHLSKTVDILEAGLTLIEVNHKLPNNVGAKGFIDILARDKLSNLIIIELKRSDHAARQALFEILKYMRLFRRQHGTPAQSAPPCLFPSDRM